MFYRLLVLFLLLPSVVYAKLASIEDADVEVLSHNEKVFIKKDQTSQIEIEIKLRILRETARERYAKYIMTYNEALSKIKIEEAATYYKGIKYPVAADMIEDKPLVSERAGFDQVRQIMVAYPKVEVGSEIYIKFTVYSFKVAIPGIYGNIYEFGAAMLEYNTNVNINSEIPLYMQVNDPNKVLKVTTNKDKEFTKAEFKVIKPVYYSLFNEPANAVSTADKKTWVAITNVAKYEDIANAVVHDTLKVFSQPLPDLFKEIANLALQKNNEVEQINTVTSLLNDKIQYHGDWRTSAGMYLPRDLKIIADTQIGDCKDFSASTGAILKHLGYQVFPALVYRGEEGNTWEMKLPLPTAFNHALIKVISKTGKIYWIDATNFESMADGIFPDIADRMALVMDINNPLYERIPAIDPNHAKVEAKKILHILNDVNAHEVTEIKLEGEAAAFLTGRALKYSQSYIEDSLYDLISNEPVSSANKSMQISPLTSRIVAPIFIKAEYDLENRIMNSNMGRGLRLLPLSRDTIDTILSVKDDTASNIMLRHPGTIRSKLIIKKINANNPKGLEVFIDSPYIKYDRKIDTVGNDIEITEEIVILKPVITNEELKSNQFKNLQKQLREKVVASILIFN